jgi:hypothetical protein
MADELKPVEVPSVSSVDELAVLLDEAAAGGYIEMTDAEWARLREELEPATPAVRKAS